MLFRFLLVVCTYTIMSCKDCDDPNNRDCPNYRDCSPYPVIKADFQTRGGQACQGLDNPFRPLGDTMLFSDFRMYGQPSGGSYYEYRIGTDPRRYNRQDHCTSFTLADSNSIINRPFPIRFIVHKTPNLQCNPNDDGRDTIVKNVFFFTPTQARYFGTWEGKFDDEPASKIRRITLKPEYDYRGQYYPAKIDIKNFTNEYGLDSAYIRVGGASYLGYSTYADTVRGAFMEAPYPNSNLEYCNTKKCEIRANSDSIKIILSPLEYRYCPYIGRRLYFRGRRVQ